MHADIKVRPLDWNEIPKSIFNQSQLTKTYAETWTADTRVSLQKWLLNSDFDQPVTRNSIKWCGLDHPAQSLKTGFNLTKLPLSRSKFEITALDFVLSTVVDPFIRPSNFLVLVDQIINVIGYSSFRNQAVFCEIDTSGRFLEYPQHDLLKDAMREIAQRVCGYAIPATIALPLLVSTLTLHPLIDGNGRLARMLFNAALRETYEHDVYLPISEISILSGSGFLFAVRDAQFYGRWQPLARVIENGAKFVQSELKRI